MSQMPGELGFMDRTFRDTNIVLLVLFGFCCGIIALIFGIIGLTTCTDPKAKQNALIVTCISGAMVVLGIVANFAGLLASR